MSYSAFGQTDSLLMASLSHTTAFSGSDQLTDVWGLEYNGSEYAIVGSRQRINIFNVDNCDDPILVAEINDGCQSVWRDFKNYGEYIYAVADQCSEGLIVFSMTDILVDDTDFSQSNTDFTRSHNVYLEEEEGRLYVVGARLGSTFIDLLVYDVATDALNPTLLYSGGLDGGYIHDMYVLDNIGYASHGHNGYYIYDFSDLTNIRTLASVDTGYGYNHSSWTTKDSNYAFVCYESYGRQMKVFEMIYNDPENDGIINDITLIERLTFHDPLEPDATDILAHNPFIKEDVMYVSYYEDGIVLFDVSDPLSPEKIAYYDTYPSNNASDEYSRGAGAWGVYPYLESGCILATDINTGFYTLNRILPQANAVTDDIVLEVGKGIVFKDSLDVLHRVTIDPMGTVLSNVISTAGPSVELKSSDLVFDVSTKGIVFETAFGAFYRMTVDNSGNLSTTSISSPSSNVIRVDGDVQFDNMDAGLIMITPSGDRRKVRVGTTGVPFSEIYNF